MHLERFIKLQDLPAYPMEMTQDGIADAVGAPRGYVQQKLKELMELGSVACIRHRVDGGRKLMKVYFLTSRGVKEAERLANAIKSFSVPTIAAKGCEHVRPVNEAPASETETIGWREGGPTAGDNTVTKNDNIPAKRDFME